jgi:2-(1,2-epoxy-1,2-dihydrophenyl)acetyl-CoA isomerase
MSTNLLELRDITYEVNEGVARLTLNRPAKLNALTWDAWAEIEQAITAAEHDDATKVVLITGAGRGFCAGTDLTAGAAADEPVRRPFTDRQALMRSRYLAPELIYRCAKPTIAAVNGVSVGAGFSLALACDIRIAAASARFGSVFVKRGITPDTGATWFLPRLVGMEQALRLMWTGRLVPADEALAIGLVSEVVPDEELAERSLAVAREVARGPSVAIELTKRLVHEGLARDLATQIEQEQFLQQVTHGTEDVIEGRRSFLEKREPVFKGR